MKAYKCDRCGKFFESEQKPQKVRFHESETKTILGITFIVQGNWSEKPDLCEDCMKSFLTWWSLER